MNNKAIMFSLILLIAAFGRPVLAAPAVEITRYQDEHSTAQLLPVRYNNAPAIAVKFIGTKDLHFYEIGRAHV